LLAAALSVLTGCKPSPEDTEATAAVHADFVALDGGIYTLDPELSWAETLIQRVGHCLERQGLLEQDTESAWLDLDPAEDTDAMPQILGSSISYCIAVGPGPTAPH
jgi:hypothetical protein